MKDGEMLLSANQIEIVLRYEIGALSAFLEVFAPDDDAVMARIDKKFIEAFTNKANEIKRLYSLIEHVK